MHDEITVSTWFKTWFFVESVRDFRDSDATVDLSVWSAVCRDTSVDLSAETSDTISVRKRATSDLIVDAFNAAEDNLSVSCLSASFARVIASIVAVWRRFSACKLDVVSECDEVSWSSFGFWAARDACIAAIRAESVDTLEVRRLCVSCIPSLRCKQVS